MIPIQSEIILLGNVKGEGIAELMQKELGAFGVTNLKGKRIDPERAAIHRTVAQAIADYNIIIIIGGMGKKYGNMTVKAVSAAIGFNTAEKDGELFPEGAEIFKNKEGFASGCAVAQGNQCIIMLPEDSTTFKFMLCYRLSPYLAEFIGATHCLKTLRTDGISAKEAEEAVSACKSFGAKLLVFEDEDEVAVQVYARGLNEREAKETANAAAKNIIGALGDAVYAVDAENIGQALGQELRKKQLKIAFAVEGMQRVEIMRSAFVNEYMDSYLGAYQGTERWQIPEKLLNRYGKNSQWTAAVLAGEACKKGGVGIGAAVTSDFTRPKDGAYAAVCMGDNLWTEKVTVPENDREMLIAKAGKRVAALARAAAAAYPEVPEGAVSLIGAVSGKSKFKTTESSDGRHKTSRFIPSKYDTKSERIRKIIFILCVAVFLGCMGYLSTKLFDSFNHRNLAATLQGLLDPSAAPADWEYLPEYYNLYRENSDFIGYIKIDDSNVEFPVVQTAKENSKGYKGQYYLRKDYYGEYSMYGTPFADYRCDLTPEGQSKNIIIYGHNIYDDGQMFSDLIKYRKLSFYKEHPTIRFDTLYERKEWLVVGAIVTNADDSYGTVWEYHNFIDGGKSKTADFVEQVKKRTLIVTGTEFDENDNFLTLSTCCYDFSDARMVIVARELREGESSEDIDTSKAYYSTNPLMPEQWYKAIAETQSGESDASYGAPESSAGSSAVGSEESSSVSISENTSSEAESSASSSVTESESSSSASESSSSSSSSVSSSSSPQSSQSSAASSSAADSSLSESKSESSSSVSESSRPISESSSSSSQSESESESSSAASSAQTVVQIPNRGNGSSSSSSSEYSAPSVTGSDGGSGYYSRSLSDTVTVNGTRMSVFDAVCQIVAYEAGYGQPDEHVKAQAVATYTYIRYNGGKLSAGVKTTVADQIKRCVAEVIGYAVLDDKSNGYILATYFSESCGETASAEWVWGYYNRNLISVASPVDGFDGVTYTISSSDFASKIESKTGIVLSGSPYNWISIESYWGDTDYVNTVSLGGKSYSARKLRESVLGTAKLRSTAFGVKYDSAKDSFVFTCYGYGHGVGMSAKGSIAYAKNGYKWDEILMKYYSNCYIGMKY